MLKLFFIRHTESIGNAAGRMMGRADDPLTDRGQTQARSLGRALAQQGAHPQTIYSSPQQRAQETAQLARSAAMAHPATGDRPRPPIITDTHLCEFDNGIFQGLTWNEARRQYPELCQKLENSWEWIPIPQSETLEAGRSRAQIFLQGLISQFIDTNPTETEPQNPDPCLWIITHHWILQHLISEILGSPRTWQISIPHGAVFELWLDQTRWQTTQELAMGLDDQQRLNHVFWQIHRFNQLLENRD